MDNAEFLGFTILGVAVIVHIIIVNITLGTGWISAMARFLAWFKRKPDLEVMSRRVFKILIIHELFSGVWGTIITVILAGLFPTLMIIATDVFFLPILIALSSILIRIPAIALFWYTWGKIRPGLHTVLGFVMAVSGFGVPFGFRYIFAEITYPYALGMALQGMKDIARIAVFFNPLYPFLALHTWFGALSIGGFIVASFFTIKGNVNPKFAWIGLWHGVLFLCAQGILGPSYLANLSSKAPLLYSNILGLAGSTFDVAPLFILKLSLIMFLVLVSIKTWRSINRGNGKVPRYAVALGPVAIMVALVGEFLNDGGRYPYLVLLGNSGLGPSQFMNVYVQVPWVTVLTVVGMLLTFVGVFMATVYYALNKRFLSDMPEQF
ncbi:MAG TPA: cytochrome ubiquinol oxidase subunit I [Candidatus Bathyarchaeia archaeon]|nr:cytochrome ubiquinol oxidase subunit I [Candidatus Bathyarchaeia archaeon]